MAVEMSQVTLQSSEGVSSIPVEALLQVSIPEANAQTCVG